jgi:(E)-4-hydroxy-3-methylbut-2-enyl-diphosphate synthase
MARWTPLFCSDGKFYTREQTRPVKVGRVQIGGGAPVSIQSMTTTKTEDIDATVAQIHRLEEAGCEIVRVAVPNEKAARALRHIKEQINIPLVADIHFDYRMALLAIEAGVDKIRWNPGNIRDKRKVEMIVKACKERGIPIRIGVNAGSLDPDLLMKYGGPTPEAMVESAAKEIALLEEWGFEDIVVSLKSSDVMDMIKAYLLFAQKFPYPTHVGVTEAGAPPEGIVWSAIGIGAVLAHGIGDTIRVSLSTDPVEEVKVAKMILRALGLRREGVRIIACPSCGRCEVDLFELVEQVKARVGHIVEPLDIAVMGCLPTGERVMTESGPKAINALREGEQVLTHEGTFATITQVLVHHFHGELLEIKPRGVPPLRLTPNHPVYAIVRNGKVKGGFKRWENIASVTANGHKPQWYFAETVNRDFVLLYPVVQGERPVERVPEAPEFAVDEDFLTLTACYVAEGSLGGNDEKPHQIFLSFGKDETELTERVLAILRRYGISASERVRDDRNTREVIIHSTALASLFARLFGRQAENKRLPTWMLTLPKPQQVILLRTLWQCDGYIGKVRGYWRATYVTVSPTLAAQVHQLLLRQGIAASLCERRQARRQVAYAITVSQIDALQRFTELLSIADCRLTTAERKQRTGRIAVDDRYLYLTVERVRFVPYHGFVYNLEVAGAQTYVGSFAVVHNCVVNGPGEARIADLGIAAGRGKAALFVEGEVVKTIQEGDIVEALVTLAEEIAEKKRKEKANDKTTE